MEFHANKKLLQSFIFIVILCLALFSILAVTTAGKNQKNSMFGIFSIPGNMVSK